MRQSQPIFPAMNKNSFGKKIVLVLSAVFLLSCHAQVPPATAGAGSSQLVLGPEAEHLYYHLVLIDALAEGNESAIENAVSALLKTESTVGAYQQGSAVFISRQNYAAAKEIALRGLSMYPEDSLLTSLLSYAYCGEGETGKAILLLQEHLEKQPDDVEITRELVRLYLSVDEKGKAQELLETLASKEESPATLFFQSKILSLSGNYAKAKSELQKLVMQYPAYAEAWLELAVIAEKEERIDEAIGFYRRALDILDDSSEIRFRIIQLLLKQNKVIDAVMTANMSSRPEIFNLQAALYLAENKYPKEAKRLVDDAIAKGANKDEAALYLSAILYHELKKPLEAIAPLEGISEKSPYYLQASQRKAELLLEGGKEKESAAIARKLRLANPDKVEFWAFEAYTLFKAGEGNKALATITDGLKAHPDSEILLFTLGSFQDERGEKDAFRETMKKIIAINPHNARALNNLAYSLALEKKDLEQALAMINSALHENPGTNYMLDTQAWVYYQMGKYDQAWVSIQKCVESADDSAEIWDHYGDIAAALNKKEEALRGWEKALQYGPENELDIRSKIKKYTGETE